jgi:uncharacterized short protein YbdD (DUF466 family)
VPDLAAWLRAAQSRIRETALLMVGLPDYRRYVAHRLAHHPGSPVMTEAEFVRDRMGRRYEGAGSGRCC